MTASNYDHALALVLVHEGGYVNNPKDHGKATNMGVTIATLAAFRGHHVTNADVAALTRGEAEGIYAANYWSPIKGDQLPPGVDYAVFDLAVNSGPVIAAKFLQRCLHVVDDGVIGDLTLKAAYQVRPADLINSLCDRRMAYLRSLGTWVTFGKGWTARVAGVRKEALAMAATPVPVLTPRPPDDPGHVTPPRPAASGGFFAALAKLLAAIVAVFREDMNPRGWVSRITRKD